mmetsp:Transcript_13990/g.40814  ORF Transcript_13990/g.40814 Transcript_13990/m.40814 type:complete len:226 (-) Transcript_13990:189-866(-)
MFLRVRDDRRDLHAPLLVPVAPPERVHWGRHHAWAPAPGQRLQRQAARHQAPHAAPVLAAGGDHAGRVHSSAACGESALHRHRQRARPHARRHHVHRRLRVPGALHAGGSAERCVRHAHQREAPALLRGSRPGRADWRLPGVHLHVPDVWILSRARREVRHLLPRRLARAGAGGLGRPGARLRVGPAARRGPPGRGPDGERERREGAGADGLRARPLLQAWGVLV